MTTLANRYSHAVVAHFYIDGAAEAIPFYERAFGAKLLFRVDQPDGRILHAEFSIGDQIVMFGDPDNSGLFAQPHNGKTTVGLHIITEDNKALFDRAVAAGADPITPVTEMFYGASSGIVRDPYGHIWVLLTQTGDALPSDREMQRLGNQAMRQG